MKIAFQLIVLFTWIAIFSGDILAQNTIYGRITDAETGLGIPFANVFLQNSNKGTASDSAGYYELKTVPIGVHKVVFSYIGYDARILLVETLLASTKERVNVSLKPQFLDLEELTVSATRPITWKKQISEFERAFLGTESMRKYCTIENRAELLFKYVDESQQTLAAFSPEPLVIENRYLGYKMNTVLHNFEWDIVKDLGQYVVSVQFDTLHTPKKREAKKWSRNRKLVYFGSERHFFTLLYRESGMGKFKIYDGKFSRIPNSEIRNVAAGDRYIHNLDLRKFKGFVLQGQARIEYESTTSYLIPQKKYFFIDEFGNIFDPTSLMVAGTWSDSRVSEMLPKEYLPK